MYKTIDFKIYSSINIGNKHEVEIINKIDTQNSYKNHFIIGDANNLLMSNNPPKLAMLGDEFDYILQKKDTLIIGSSTSSSDLLRYCRKHDIANFELLAKLPGKMGGLVKMNAGLKQWEIFNHLLYIKTRDGIINKEDIPHSYRDTQIDGIIYEIGFKLTKGFDKQQLLIFNQMRQNQPKLPSAGSCFKNPKDNSAGYLIEQVGLKGHTIGNMAFSSKHANFLVNLGGGTYDQAIKLINLAIKSVKKEFGITLETEIIIVH